jgi:hypothetical protein
VVGPGDLCNAALHEWLVGPGGGELAHVRLPAAEAPRMPGLPARVLSSPALASRHLDACP